MRVVRGTFEAEFIPNSGGAVSADLRICVPILAGGEVLMGRNVSIWCFVATAGVGLDLTIQYSVDFGATFADRGTVDLVAPGVPVFFVTPALGTDVRIIWTNPDLGFDAFLTSQVHLT